MIVRGGDIGKHPKQDPMANPNPRTDHLMPPWQPGKSANPAGYPKGRPNITTRIKTLLEHPERLPKALRETINSAIGEDRDAIDATIIATVMESLQGNTKATKLLWEYGWGKVPDKLQLEDTDGHTVTVDMQTLARSMAFIMATAMQGPRVVDVEAGKGITPAEAKTDSGGLAGASEPTPTSSVNNSPEDVV